MISLQLFFGNSFKKPFKGSHLHLNWVERKSYKPSKASILFFCQIIIKNVMSDLKNKPVSVYNLVQHLGFLDIKSNPFWGQHGHFFRRSTGFLRRFMEH